MRNCTVVFILLLVTAIGYTGNLQRSLEFGELELVESGQYVLPRIEGIPSMGEPGEPVLPVEARTLILPPGEELVQVRVLNIRWTDVPGTFIPTPGSELFPLSSRNYLPLAPDPAIYESDNYFPLEIVSDIQTGFLRGYSIGNFLVHPVRWNPVTQTAQRLESINLELVTEQTQRAGNALTFLRGGDRTEGMLIALTSDRGNMQLYNQELDELDELDPQLLIICAPAHILYWMEYAEYKNLRGIPTTIITTGDDIYPNYEGTDNAEKVRNAIIDYYTEYNIEHVLLGGDVAYVPYRGLYCESYPGGAQDNLPSDLYFAALDGSWNEDNDNRWGEPAESDLYQEITVGRAPVSSGNLIESWTEKQMLYQDEPIADQITEALMAGEDLGWTSWGGDYKDEVAYSTNRYGYSTVGFPDDWNIDTIYDRDATWTWSQLFARFNNGVHFVNHLGHANTTYGLKATNNNVSDVTLTNDGVENSRFLLYTQGCYCGAFDDNCIMERFNNIDNGAFAVISNSRYGWGSGNDTNGPSQRYDRQFFDAIFNENLSLVGEVNRDSKHDNVAYINNSCMRWCYYELNLFGDPSLDLYTDTPEELDIDLPQVYSLGDDYLTLSANGEAWAVIVIIWDDEVIRVGQTDALGNANIPLELDNPGELTVNIIAHNHLRYSGTVQVIAADGPFPTVTECIVADNESGNGNGRADFGEEITLEMEIVNLGLDPITSMTVSLESYSSALEFETDEMTVENLEAGESVILDCPATIDVEVTDNTHARVMVHFISDENEEDRWEREISIPLHAPRLFMAIDKANDENDGNGNHRLNPGETSTMVVTVRNEGSADLSDATLEVYCDNPYITNLEASDETFSVSAEGSMDIEAAYTITVDDDAPDLYRATILLRVVMENGYVFRTVDLIDIGGVYEDADGNEQPLTHYAINDGGDQWHISMERNWTHNGSFSWKCGNPAGGDAEDNLDACLELPAVPRTGTITLSFRHWMEAEISVQHGGECYDGGRVEASVDQETWIVAPMSGYNYTTRGDGTFGAGNMVYSGAIDWEEQSYTFAQGGGDSLWIRFRYVTDTDIQNQEIYDGWYLDDISLSLGPELTPPHSISGELVENSARIEWMTPDSELDQDFDILGFKIYRNDEVLVESVPDVIFNDDLTEMEPATYTYQVTAVYQRGETDPIESAGTDEIEIVWEGVRVKEAPLPISWAFEPPFPNPFNPETSVKLAVPVAADVQFVVYDLLGREVLRLFEGRIQPGYHQFTIDGSNWSSGMYFVSLNTPELKQIRKMVLMK
ncbi:C25 family cysteine peptidase [Calditrichota bacterium]